MRETTVLVSASSGLTKTAAIKGPSTKGAKISNRSTALRLKPVHCAACKSERPQPAGEGEGRSYAGWCPSMPHPDTSAMGPLPSCLMVDGQCGRLHSPHQPSRIVNGGFKSFLGDRLHSLAVRRGTMPPCNAQTGRGTDSSPRGRRDNAPNFLRGCDRVRTDSPN